MIQGWHFAPGPWKAKAYLAPHQGFYVMAPWRHVCNVKSWSDACLIAAAPEMYELLRGLADVLAVEKVDQYWGSPHHLVSALLIRIDDEAKKEPR